MSSASPRRLAVAAINTNQFAPGKFAPHGLVDASFTDDILRVEACGPFNLEVMQALGELRMALADRLQAAEHFAHMLIIRGSSLMSPEAYECYRKERSAAYGRVIHYPCATALVAGPEVEGWSLMAPRILEVYKADGVPYRVFADETKAFAWLGGELQARRHGSAAPGGAASLPEERGAWRRTPADNQDSPSPTGLLPASPAIP